MTPTDERTPDEIDKLVDYGLERYGLGDVDGALVAWEQALSLDPDDPRAAAYVDYVRENYELLAGGPRERQQNDADLPVGFDPLPGESDYEVEVTPAPPDVPLMPPPLDEPSSPLSLSALEKYLSAVDDGWFLDDEGGKAPTPAKPQPRTGGTDPPPLGRSSSLQLPLPPDPGPTPELMLEMEADEPDLGLELPGSLPPGSDEEKTGDFAMGAGWQRGHADQGAADPADPVDLGDPADFLDQKSAAPTQEIDAPRGFVRPRSPIERGVDPDDGEEDRLGTRPGRSTGPIPIDTRGPPRVAPEALADFGGAGTGAGRLGPDERTRESPVVRVSFNLDTQDLPAFPAPPPAPAHRRAPTDTPTDEDEHTIERPGVRLMPSPIDVASEDTSGQHPPLVIIEHPVPSPPLRPTLELDGPPPGPPEPPPPLMTPGADQRHRAPTSDSMFELSPDTAKLRGIAVRAGAPTIPPPRPGPTGPFDEIGARVDAEVEVDCPADEPRGDRTRRRIGRLLERAIGASQAGDHATAVVALDLALSEEPDSAVAQKLIHKQHAAVLDIYQRFLGQLGARPSLAMPMHELSNQRLDIRAAFLLSRIDGSLTFEEILDVSGMQRAEAFRHLAVLVLRGILEVR